MSDYARVDFSGPPMSCLAAVSWPLKPPSGNSVVNVLKIESKNGACHYVSASSMFKAETSTIKLNGKFGQLLTLQDGQEVSVSAVESKVPSVRSVLVNCDSDDDWEILETNAESLTNNLLNQLRVVYPGLRFPFWVSKSLSINLCVEKLTPAVELGILDTCSEVIVPSIVVEKSDNFELNHSCQLRLCPVTLHPEVTLTSSAFLLLSNIEYAYAFQSALLMGGQGKCDFNRDNSSFFAKITSDEVENKKEDVIIKIFFIEYILESEKELRNLFPLVNPPTLYVHPKLAEENHLKLKSRVFIEQVGHQALANNIPRYSSLVRSSKFVSTDVFQQLFHQSQAYLIAALELNYSFIGGLLGPNNGCILITGKEGSGKTFFACSLAKSLTSVPYFVHMEIISCAKFRSKKSETVQKELEAIFQNAVTLCPAVIILDDLDVLCPANKSEQQNIQEEFFHYRMCETVYECIMNLVGKHIVIVCTSKTVSTLHTYWKNREGFHTFQHCVHIPPPNSLERLCIFRDCLRRYQSRTETITMSSSITTSPDSASFTASPSLMTASRTVEGSHIVVSQRKDDSPPIPPTSDLQLEDNHMTDSMLNCLFNLHDDASTPKAIHNIAKKWALFLAKGNTEDMSSEGKDSVFEEIVQNEITFKEKAQEHKKPKLISWNRIGGLSAVKEELTKILRWPIKYSKLFDNTPIKMPSGILLYGFPGTGKTLVGLSMPSLVANTKFIHIKGPELLSKYIGASEQAVQDLFQKAKNLKPCILFFDEFDSLVPRRGHDSTGVTDRVVNQFLAEMDGIEGGLGKGVYLIAATSRPDLIDPAVLRPGRLDKHLFFDMPTKGERLAIISALSEELEFSDSDGEILWDEIGRKTEGFTGADLHSLLCTAQLEAIQESLADILKGETDGFGEDNQVEVDPHEKIPVTKKHITAAMENFKPSLPAEESSKFQTIYENFGGTKRVQMDNPNPSSMLIEHGKKATLA
ncbi:unnamed protein product [Allacma fusca]|uniref:Peroxisomal ATPase PEX1 n=1 Tax=Allacma fusca TaxID=39272 RepID=A0A8J2NK07_9HEXA|nr:unnamed protein product [Allacma fusca]